MSDNKLKSEDGKPASPKTAEKKTPAASKSKAETIKTTTASSKTSAANPKAKKAKASSEKTSKAETPDTKATEAKSSNKKSSKTVKSNAKKIDPAKPLVATDAKLATDAKKVTSKGKDKKTTPPLSAKPENGAAPKPSKRKSFARMITVAAVLFLGVLFVFLRGSDPVSEEEQTASNLPATQAEAPNPNASSPYGMRVEQLKEIETLLANLNLDPGSIDGDIDHEAVAAISLFQEISGLQVDGRPSPDLLVDLKAVEQLLKVE